MLSDPRRGWHDPYCAPFFFGDVELQDKLRFILNRNVVFHLWLENEILSMINQRYGQFEAESADSVLQEFIDFTELTTEPSLVPHQ